MVTTSRDQFVEAKRIAKTLRTPLKDTLHAILARDSHAIVITRDKHFSKLKSVVNISRPED